MSRVLVAAAALAAAAAQQGAPQVNVTLYEESLCPDCIRFITTMLSYSAAGFVRPCARVPLC